MPKEKQNGKRVSTHIPDKTYDTLKAEAQKKGLTVSSLIRMIVMEYTEKPKEKG